MAGALQTGRREGEARVATEEEGLSTVIALPEIEVTLPLADLYADLKFEAAPR